MNRYLICENAACYFVLEVSSQERQAIRRQPILTACPECGSNFGATCPFSGRLLLVQWLGGLPHCACCRRRLQASKANAESHATPAPPPVPASVENVAKHR